MEYHKLVKKIQINKCNDFEEAKKILSNNKWKLELISIQDLELQNNKTFFIIRTNYIENNFLIIYKDNKGFVINDKKISIEDILEFDAIDCYKICKENDYSLYKKIINESTSYFIISFFSNLVIFGISLLLNSYIKIVFDKLILTDNIKIIFITSISFMIISILKIFLGIMLSIYENTKINKLTLNSLENLINYSYYENNSNNLFKNLSYLNLYIKTNIFDKPDFYSSLIVNFIILTITFSMGYQLFVLNFCSIIGSIFLSYLKSKINKIFFNKNIENQSEFSNMLNSFAFFCKNEKNYNKFIQYKNNLLKKINSNIEFDILHKKEDYKITLISESISKIIYFTAVVIISYFFVSQKINSLSSIIIFIGLIEISNNNSKSIFSFLSVHNEYKLAKQFFLKINSFSFSNEIKKSTTKKVIFNDVNLYLKNKKTKNINLILKHDTIVIGSNGIGKTSLFTKAITNSFLKTNNLSLNDIIYQNSNTELNLINWPSIISNEKFYLVKKIIDEFKLNLSGELSQGEKQILNFVLLILQENKIIFLDESLSNVDKMNKIKIMEKVKPIIEKNNFLTMISHDRDDIKYFKYQENLDERI